MIPKIADFILHQTQGDRSKMNTKLLKQDIVTQTVRKWLQLGRYVPGDQLPTSEELANYFQINKRTVANGLAPLVKEGLLERKTYHGTIVRAISHVETTGNEVALLTVGQSQAYGNLANALNQQLTPHGMYPVLIDEKLVNKIEDIRSFLMRLTERKTCAGFLIEGSTNVPYELLRQYPMRFPRQVYMFRYHCTQDIPGAGYVLIDTEDIGRQAVEYYAERNVRNLFIPALYERDYSGPHSSMQEQILRGILKHAPAHGIKVNEEAFWRLHRCTNTFEHVTRELFLSKNPPDAIFGWGDAHLLEGTLPFLDTLSAEWRHKLSILSIFNMMDRQKAGFPSFDFRGLDVLEIATDMILGKQRREKVILPAKLVMA